MNRQQRGRSYRCKQYNHHDGESSFPHRGPFYRNHADLRQDKTLSCRPADEMFIGDGPEVLAQAFAHPVNSAKRDLQLISDLPDWMPLRQQPEDGESLLIYVSVCRGIADGDEILCHRCGREIGAIVHDGEDGCFQAGLEFVILAEYAVNPVCQEVMGQRSAGGCAHQHKLGAGSGCPELSHEMPKIVIEAETFVEDDYIRLMLLCQPKQGLVVILSLALRRLQRLNLWKRKT